MKIYNIIEALNEPIGTKFNVEGNRADVIVKDAIVSSAVAKKGLFWMSPLGEEPLKVDNYTTKLKLIKIEENKTDKFINISVNKLNDLLVDTVCKVITPNDLNGLFGTLATSMKLSAIFIAVSMEVFDITTKEKIKDNDFSSDYWLNISTLKNAISEVFMEIPKDDDITDELLNKIKCLVIKELEEM